MYKAPELKIDAMNFAKAVEKFGKILGIEIVTGGNPNKYKKLYKDLVDKQGYWEMFFSNVSCKYLKENNNPVNLFQKLKKFMW